MQDIDLITLLRLVLKKWRVVFIWCVAITLLGLVIVFTTPHVYQSTALLAPEQIAETGPEDAIYPEIYPNIVGSTDFCCNYSMWKSAQSTQRLKQITKITCNTIISVHYYLIPSAGYMFLGKR